MLNEGPWLRPTAAAELRTGPPLYEHPKTSDSPPFMVTAYGRIQGTMYLLTELHFFKIIPLTDIQILLQHVRKESFLQSLSQMILKARNLLIVICRPKIVRISPVLQWTLYMFSIQLS